MSTKASTAVSIRRIMRIAEFRATLREFESRTEEVTRRVGLTPQRYLLLLFVKGASDGGERATMSELKHRLKVSPNTVSDLVSRAEEAGFVIRTPAKHDLRVVYVSLTEEGERLLDAAISASEEYRREFSRRFEAMGSAFRAAQRP
jgi:DNA-binding MarR family transcriptional regulator